jgi:hypothetical protein
MKFVNEDFVVIVAHQPKEGSFQRFQSVKTSGIVDGDGVLNPRVHHRAVHRLPCRCLCAGGYLRWQRWSRLARLNGGSRFEGPAGLSVKPRSALRSSLDTISWQKSSTMQRRVGRTWSFSVIHFHRHTLWIERIEIVLVGVSTTVAPQDTAASS